MKKILLSLFIALAISGCASIPQEAGLNLKPNFSMSKLGNNKKVALIVQDERDSNTIGYRGAGLLQTGEVTLRNIESIIKSNISNGLQKKGFLIDDSALKTNNLNIKITNISYKMIPGIVSGTTKVEATAKVIAKNNNELYERVYRAENEDDMFFVNTSDENQVQIDAAVSELLTKIMNDNYLIKHLTM